MSLAFDPVDLRIRARLNECERDLANARWEAKQIQRDYAEFRETAMTWLEERNSLHRDRTTLMLFIIGMVLFFALFCAFGGPQ